MKEDKIYKALSEGTLSEQRKTELEPLASFLMKACQKQEVINLIFVCTHNSRRSQFAQVWAKVASHYFGINIGSFSAGVEVTECNERTISSLKRTGFDLTKKGEINPIYTLDLGEENLELHSKLIESDSNPQDNYAAIMVCDHANENCPYLPNAKVRIPLLYQDPKSYDNTSEEQERYDERSKQIAREMGYIFGKVKADLK